MHAVTVYEFLFASVLLSLEVIVSLDSSISLALKNISVLFSGFHEQSRERFYGRITFRTKYSKVSHSALCPVVVSVCIPNYYGRMLF